MKLRIRGNSVRLRITQMELERIRAGKAVAEFTDFGGGRRLTYRLVTDPAVGEIGAAYEEGVITVSLPTDEARRWTNTELVSLSGEQSLDDDGTQGSTLAILVEKDFHCLAPREGEDESDMFPHPEAATGGC